MPPLRRLFWRRRDSPPLPAHGRCRPVTPAFLLFDEKKENKKSGGDKQVSQILKQFKIYGITVKEAKTVGWESNSIKTPRRLSIGKSREAYEGILLLIYAVNGKIQEKFVKFRKFQEKLDASGLPDIAAWGIKKLMFCLCHPICTGRVNTWLLLELGHYNISISLLPRLHLEHKVCRLSKRVSPPLDQGMM